MGRSDSQREFDDNKRLSGRRHVGQTAKLRDTMPRPVFCLLSYMVITGCATIYLYKGRNVSAKRRFAPWYFFGGGALFVAVIAVSGFGLWPVAPMAVLVTIIAALNQRKIRFCDRCGRTSLGDHVFKPAKHCARCGAALHK
jgi:uncharacterized membrane protein YdcZ (DUF606 family)